MIAHEAERMDAAAARFTPPEPGPFLPRYALLLLALALSPGCSGLDVSAQEGKDGEMADLRRESQRRKEALEISQQAVEGLRRKVETLTAERDDAVRELAALHTQLEYQSGKTKTLQAAGNATMAELRQAREDREETRTSCVTAVRLLRDAELALAGVRRATEMDETLVPRTQHSVRVSTSTLASVNEAVDRALENVQKAGAMFWKLRPSHSSGDEGAGNEDAPDSLTAVTAPPVPSSPDSATAPGPSGAGAEYGAKGALFASERPSTESRGFLGQLYGLTRSQFLRLFESGRRWTASDFTFLGLMLAALAFLVWALSLPLRLMLKEPRERELLLLRRIVKNMDQSGEVRGASSDEALPEVTTVLPARFEVMDDEAPAAEEEEKAPQAGDPEDVVVLDPTDSGELTEATVESVVAVEEEPEIEEAPRQEDPEDVVEPAEPDEEEPSEFEEAGEELGKVFDSWEESSAGTGEPGQTQVISDTEVMGGARETGGDVAPLEPRPLGRNRPLDAPDPEEHPVSEAADEDLPSQEAMATQAVSLVPEGELAATQSMAESPAGSPQQTQEAAVDEFAVTQAILTRSEEEFASTERLDPGEDKAPEKDGGGAFGATQPIRARSREELASTQPMQAEFGEEGGEAESETKSGEDPSATKLLESDAAAGLGSTQPLEGGQKEDLIQTQTLSHGDILRTSAQETSKQSPAGSGGQTRQLDGVVLHEFTSTHAVADEAAAEFAATQPMPEVTFRDPEETAGGEKHPARAPGSRTGKPAGEEPPEDQDIIAELEHLMGRKLEDPQR